MGKYSYLGNLIDEHLNYNTSAITLCCAAGRSLGSIISTFNPYKNMGFYYLGVHQKASLFATEDGVGYL